MAGRHDACSIALFVGLVAFCAPATPLSCGAEEPAPPERIDAARDPRRISRDVKIDVKLEKGKAEFTPLEPIRLEITVQNVSVDRQLFSCCRGTQPDADYRIIPIKVFDSNGELVPLTRYGDYDVRLLSCPRGGGLGSELHLEPGQEYQRTLLANMVRDMTSPDEYTILVEFPTGVMKEIDGVKVQLVGQSDPIKVKVIADPRLIWILRPRATWAQLEEGKKRVEALRRKQEQEETLRKRTGPTP